MLSSFPWQSLETPLQIAIGAVWVFHGLYSKLLNRIARHQQIVPL